MYDYFQKNNESFDAWKIRLVVDKIDGSHDLDWMEIKEILRLDFSHETLRKQAPGIYETYQFYAQKKENILSQDEIEDKRLEFEKERKKKQTVNVEYNKLVREEARRELLFEQIQQSIETLPTPEFEQLQPSKSGSKEYLLSFGDIHFGKQFESLNNTYSEDEVEKRMNEMIRQTVEIIEKESISHLHVLNLSDSVEGMSLRVSQLKSLQSGFVDQVIKFCKLYTTWLNELSKYVNISLHHLESANHGEIRPHNSSRGEFPAEDMERIIAMYTQDVLANNDRIDVVKHDSGYAHMNIAGFDMIALHGHQIKNNKNVLKDLSFLHKRFYSHVFLGHFHHGNTLTVGENASHNMEVVQVPSVMGSDEYSDSLMTGSKAGASLHVFEENKGRTLNYNLILN